MLCDHCKKEIPNQSKFCKYCGQPVHSVSPENEKTELNDSETSNLSGGNKKWIILAACIFICAAVLCGALTWKFQGDNAEEADSKIVYNEQEDPVNKDSSSEKSKEEQEKKEKEEKKPTEEIKEKEKEQENKEETISEQTKETENNSDPGMAVPDNWTLQMRQDPTGYIFYGLQPMTNVFAKINNTPYTDGRYDMGYMTSGITIIDNIITGNAESANIDPKKLFSDLDFNPNRGVPPHKMQAVLNQYLNDYSIPAQYTVEQTDHAPTESEIFDFMKRLVNVIDGGYPVIVCVQGDNTDEVSRYVAISGYGTDLGGRINTLYLSGGCPYENSGGRVDSLSPDTLIRWMCNFQRVTGFFQYLY